ncbi:hypothetical protein IEQ34_018233 [Dendrobium chrysotoxum]|uniref:Uncharacterized protein n=1 Tax=Dendrobium chrysotoxum TaxID=161865 RepID=A0AAV7GDD5_DENCH|nr:hypothetical protein IEQ34_018233 [Dendrobium chrysotoxum]
MSMGSDSSNVQSLPNPKLDISSPLSTQFEQSFVFKPENSHQLQGRRMSANQVSKILEASMAAQKMGMKLTKEAINPTTSSNLDWKFINCYLDSTVLLLDACNNIQLRLKSIRSFLDLIPIGLHYLEGEHEPSRVVLQRVIAALESIHFQDERHYNKMEKSMYRMRTFGKKLNGHKLTYRNSSDSTSPNLYKTLSGSWSRAVFAIGVVQFAISFRPLTSPYINPSRVEPWTMLLKELSNKKVFPRKSNETASMEELANVDLAVQTMLKLISTRQTGNNSNLQQMAVKVAARELKRRKEDMEKTLLLFEEKIGELYKLTTALRINMLELLSQAQKAEVLEIVKPSNYEDIQMDNNLLHYQMEVDWVKVKKKLPTRSFSLGRFRRHCIAFIRSTSVKPCSNM